MVNRARQLRVPALMSLLLVSVLILTSVADAAPSAAGGSAAASASGPTVGETVDRQGPPVLHRAYPGSAKASIPARRSQGELEADQLSTFSVNYLAAGTVWRDYVCQAWPPEAKAAFGYATSVWGSLLKSNVPVTIDACWTLLEKDVFGGAFPSGYARNFTGAPLRDTWYPYALANALHGSDTNTTLGDITAVFSSGFPWYFGTSGSPGPGQFDFVTAVLRELGYGLGYESSMWVEGDTGNWGISRVDDQVISPDAYDRLVVNGSGQSLIGGFPNASSALAAQLQSNNVFFDGAQAKAANGGDRPKLFAPSPWKEGWSISYLDPVHDGSPNALMTYTLTPGEVIHDPGPMGLAILNDLGWSGGPSVTALRPASGSVGTSVAISGTNLSGATAVSFNGVSASFTSFSAAEIVATVPAGATSGPVRVTTPNGTATSTTSFTVTDDKQPQVTFLSTPARLADTRPMSGYHYAGQTLQGYGAAPRRFKLAGEGGIPANAAAVLVNLTAVGYPADGWLSAYPACTPLPATSSLNFDTVENAIANSAVVKLGVAAAGTGCQGAIDVTGASGTNVIVDAVGYLVSSAEDQLVLLDSPERMVDTRPGSGRSGDGTPIPPNPLYSHFTLADPAGEGPIPANATAVLVNLTAVGYRADGWVAAWPGCKERPEISSLNFDPDENAIANFALVKLGEGEGCQGSIDVTATSSTNFIVDVVGYLVSTPSDQVALLPTPQRFVDTRQAGAGGPLQKGVARCFPIAGQGGVPADARGVALNLTATGFSRDGWIAAYPAGEQFTGTSSVNFDTQEYAIANTALVRPGTEGRVCVLASEATNVIIDVSGYLR